MKRLLVIAVVVVLVLAGAWYYLSAPRSWGGVGEEAYVPELTVTLYSKSTSAEVYRADMSMDVDDQSFLDHFFPASVAGDDFPPGDNLLELQIFELPHINADKYNQATRHKVDRHWYIGDLYGQQEAGSQEWKFTIELPELTTEKTSESGAVYLLGVVRYDGHDIAMKRWTIYTETMEVLGN